MRANSEQNYCFDILIIQGSSRSTFQLLYLLSPFGGARMYCTWVLLAHLARSWPAINADYNGAAVVESSPPLTHMYHMRGQLRGLM